MLKFNQRKTHSLFVKLSQSTAQKMKFSIKFSNEVSVILNRKLHFFWAVKVRNHLFSFKVARTASQDVQFITHLFS